MLAVVSVWVALFDASQLDQVRRQVISARLLLRELVDDRPARLVLRAVRDPAAARHICGRCRSRSSSTSCGRGCCCSASWLIPQPPRAAADDAGLAAGLDRRDGPSLPPRLRPDPRVRGHRHPSVHAADRGGAGDRLAERAAAPGCGQPPPAAPARRFAGRSASLAIVLLVWKTDAFSSFLYPYGFLLLSLATAAVVAAVVHPASRVGAALGCGPLRWIGVRSYGIYLWQWPIIVLATPAGQTSRTGSAAALEVAATVAIASPLVALRRGAGPPRARSGGCGASCAAARARIGAQPRAVALSAVLAAVLIPLLGLAGALPAASASLTSTSVRRSRRPARSDATAVARRPREPGPHATRRAPQSRPRRAPRPRPRASRSSTSATRPRRARPPTTTSRTTKRVAGPAGRRRRADDDPRDLRGALDRRDVRGASPTPPPSRRPTSSRASTAAGSSRSEPTTSTTSTRRRPGYQTGSTG